MSDELRVAASAARYLASAVAPIRALRETGASERAVKRLLDELNDALPTHKASIRAVTNLLRQTRDRAIKLGDISAPTAHEIAIELVHALNREVIGKQFGHENIGRKQILVWPDTDELIAELELEHTKAVVHREFPAAPINTSETQAEAPDGTTILYHGNQSYSLAGRDPETVSAEQHNFLTAFLEAQGSLTTPQLEKAGVSNPSKVAGKLRTRFPNSTARVQMTHLCRCFLWDLAA